MSRKPEFDNYMNHKRERTEAHLTVSWKTKSRYHKDLVYLGDPRGMFEIDNLSMSL